MAEKKTPNPPASRAGSDAELLAANIYARAVAAGRHNGKSLQFLAREAREQAAVFYEATTGNGTPEEA